MSMGGDGDGDDRAAMAQWNDNDGQAWRLPAWSKSPRQLQDEASDGLHAMFASVNAASHKHDQPRLPPNRMRLL